MTVTFLRGRGVCVFYPIRTAPSTCCKGWSYMAKKDNELSAAEQYRKERKARIAKANAAAGKKGVSVSLPPVNKKRNRIISIVIIILAALLVAVGLIFFFGVPQQLNTVMTINGEKVS